MAEEERDFLHRSPELSIELVVDDEGVAKLLFETDGSEEFDLTAEDDFVVVFDTVGLPVDVASQSRAVATIGPVSRLEEGGTLMVRVGEFLEGWDF